MPDLARWLRHGVAVLLYPICSGVVGTQNGGEVGLRAERHDTGGVASLQLFDLDIAAPFDLPIHGKTYFNGTIFLFVDCAVKDTERCTCRFDLLLLEHVVHRIQGLANGIVQFAHFDVMGNTQHLLQRELFNVDFETHRVLLLLD